ncbi:MAG: efflux RND transporter periplasmic adaptor subunit [Vicinamibacterales bacterium]
MKRIAWILTLTGLVGAIGCGGGAKVQPEAVEHERASVAATAAPGDQNAVSVTDEMLRDLRVTTSVVEEHQGAEAASMLGELGINENAYAEVGAPIQARIIQLPVRVGQRVTVGAALATLQSGELARGRSEVTTAEARATLARRALERKRALNAERIVPTREVQEAENELAAADDQVRAARASLASLGVTTDAPDANPSALILRSPITGTVIERAGVLGQMAEPSTTLFKIADLSTVWLTVHAFERDAVRLDVGAAARITFAAMPGQTFAGTVSFIGQRVEPDSRTVPVRIDLPNAGGQLRPGMSATAWLPVGDPQSRLLAVPAAALQRVRDRWCVFVPKDGRTFEIRAVGRGRDLAGEVEIVSGLKAGDTVVVDGAFLLKAEAEKSAEEHEEH